MDAPVKSSPPTTAPDASSVVRSLVLIDDDADFLHVLKKYLQSQRAEYAPTGPVEISTFADPVEALVNLPAEGICVVLIDYNLPTSTGVDWVPKLVKAGLGPVILLTNMNDANIAAEAFRAGVSDYVAKGDVMTEKRLGRAIREAVQRYRLETSNTSLTRQLKLMNVELDAKNKRLRELTETAHQFVDDVAHDFRTPLTVIQQYASIMKDGLSGPVNDRQSDHLGIIAEATAELSQMVDDFLDSSKLRSRTLSVQRESHTVDELFKSTEPMLAVRAEPKKIAIERDIAEGVPPFFADLSMAGRVLTNLAVNAIKVTPEGRTLRLWARLSEGGDVQIGVTDQGPGLRPQDVEVIFERFKQLHEPQSSGAKGFGIGLSIVKQLTWLNLGGIAVESEVGKGSTFSFTLPADDVPRILTGFLENIQTLDTVGDLWMLRVRARGGESDPSMLRQLISTFCYPMDLVLPGNDEGAVIAIGVSNNPNRWAERLGEETRQFRKSIGQDANAELEIKPIASWPRNTDRATLLAALSEHLLAGVAHA